MPKLTPSLERQIALLLRLYEAQERACSPVGHTAYPLHDGDRREEAAAMALRDRELVTQALKKPYNFAFTPAGYATATEIVTRYLQTPSG